MSPSCPEGVTIKEVEVARLADAGMALLVGVREDDEWAAGHALAALQLPLGNVPGTQLPTDETVLAICRSGNRSPTAAALLLARGVDAPHIAGGMRAWQAASLAVTTNHEPPGTSP